jgi:hypothetical protein
LHRRIDSPIVFFQKKVVSDPKETLYMHRDYFGSPSQSNLRAKYDQSVEKMRAPDPGSHNPFPKFERTQNVSLGPNQNVSSFTPYNQQFLPSEPDARRRQKDADDRANYEYSHPSYTGSFLEKEFGVLGTFMKRPGDIALGSMLAAKSAGISDISWFKIIRAWIWWRLIWPPLVLAGFALSLVLVLALCGAGYIVYQDGPSGLAKWWNKSPAYSAALDPTLRNVTPTQEVYRAQQEEREKGLTPTKPTPSYGTNSVVNQPAQAQAAIAPVAPSQEQQRMAGENAIRNDYDRIRFMEQTKIPALRARQETQFYQERCQTPPSHLVKWCGWWYQVQYPRYRQMFPPQQNRGDYGYSSRRGY